ncbi:helix-turn-helix domain-containing protein [Mycolicibacterium elephantis]
MSNNTPLLVSIADTQTILGGVSKPTVYGLIHKGELTKVKIGRRGMVTAESLTAYVERITEKAQGAA